MTTSLWRLALGVPLLLTAGSAVAQSPGTLNLLGPSTTPGAPQITSVGQLNAPINAALAAKADALNGTLTNPTLAGTVDVAVGADISALPPFSTTKGGIVPAPGSATGKLLGDGGWFTPSYSGATVTPTGAPTALANSALAAQQGVLLDAFKVSSDADDTASMTRAVAAGVPILLGPRTYAINNFNTGAVSSFVLRGVPGLSVIQRTAASGSQFFAIGAASVVIDGVTFDMNKAAVTANQWGVFLGAHSQTVSISRSVFKNNSGSLGVCLTIQTNAAFDGGSFNISDNEISGCVAPVGGALYLASASHGVVSRNFVHDNTASGIFAQTNGTVTSSNYLTDVLIAHNRVERNSGQGISVGGYPIPFVYATALPPATHVTVDSNLLTDNALYQVLAQGDYINITNNQAGQSSPSVVIYGGLVGPGRYGIVANNIVAFSGVPWGIDWGGGIEMTISGNTVTMDQGAAMNVGASTNLVAVNNHLIVSGTAQAMTSENYEQGGGVPLPSYTSGSVIENNTFDLTGTGTAGLVMRDNSGGSPGMISTSVRNNKFNGTGAGVNSGQAITWLGASASLTIDGNLYNGRNFQGVDPQPNGDVLFDLVYCGGLITGITSTNPVRSIVPLFLGLYGGGGSIIYVMPDAGGSGYTAATVLTASGSGGGSGWTGKAMIIGGVIIGVRTTALGSGYAGTVTVTATDSGGGSGATFTVGNNPGLPTGAKITYLANTPHLLQRTGGIFTIASNGPFQMASYSEIILQAPSTGTGLTGWNVVAFETPTFPIGSLPTCDLASTSARIFVSGSVSGKWQAECNGTAWIAPDGATIN